MEKLKGKKTYILALIAGVLMAVQVSGWWQVPPEVWGILGIGGAASIRAGIGKK